MAMKWCHVILTSISLMSNKDKQLFIERQPLRASLLCTSCHRKDGRVGDQGSVLWLLIATSDHRSADLEAHSHCCSISSQRPISSPLRLM